LLQYRLGLAVLQRRGSCLFGWAERQLVEEKLFRILPAPEAGSTILLSA
jgi:hypothetical protein